MLGAYGWRLFTSCTLCAQHVVGYFFLLAFARPHFLWNARQSVPINRKIFGGGSGWSKIFPILPTLSTANCEYSIVFHVQCHRHAECQSFLNGEVSHTEYHARASFCFSRDCVPAAPSIDQLRWCNRSKNTENALIRAIRRGRTPDKW